MIATDDMLTNIVEQMSIEINLCKSIALKKGAVQFYYYPVRFPDNVPAVKVAGASAHKAIAYISLNEDGHVRIV